MYELKLENVKNLRNYQSQLYKAKELLAQGFGEIWERDIVGFLDDDDKRKVKYSFYLKKTIYKKICFSFEVDQNDVISNVLCGYCLDKDYCFHMLAIIIYNEKITNELKQTNPDKYNLFLERIENDFKHLEQERYEILYEERRKSSLKEINELMTQIKEKDTLPVLQKISLDCLLLRMKKEYILSLKVGTDKMYVVQNVYKFINLVDTEEYATYGKSFNFKHTLENFTESAQKIILFLKNLGPNYLNNRTISLSSIMIEKLISILKENVVYLSDGLTDYKIASVKLDVCNVRLKFTKDYHLEIVPKGIIIEGYSQDYMYYDNKVDVIQYPDEAFRKLVRFVSDNKDFLYTFVKDVFTKDIYPRFSDYIDVDESLKDEFRLAEYTIKGYFDIVDSVLIVSTKFYKDDQEVTIEAMTSVSYKLNKYKNYLQSFGFNDEGRLGEMVKIINFLKADFSELRKIAEIYLSENIKKMQVKKMSKCSTYISYNVDMMQICFKDSEYTDEELSKIMKSLRKKVRYVKLNKDTIVEIDEETANRLLNTIDEFALDIDHLKENQDVPLYQSLKLADEDLNIIDYNINDNLKNLIGEVVNYKSAEFELPKYLKDVMRPYQIEAFYWMKTLVKYSFCGILADDMGLGKTLETISVLCTDKEEAPILVVCPKSLCYNWKNEFALWGSEFTVNIIIGSVPERMDMIKNIDNNKRVVYICSYDSLRNDIEYYKDKYFKYLLLDEAQSIKNHETLKAKSVKQLKSKIRFVLTGTPIENSVIDLWSIFDFLMPGYLGNYTKFKSIYERAVVEKSNNELVERLIRKITPFVLRRTKKDVLKDLPDKVEIIQMTTMTDKQKKIYDAQIKRTREILESNSDDKILILSCLTRLRQICVDPGLFVEEYDELSSKLTFVLDLIDNYIKDGHKIVLFSQFVSVFEKIGLELLKRNYHYSVITGKTSAEDRVKLASNFNDEDSIEKVFLVSLKAGGVGLNLIGADIVIHLDPWWNFAVQNQATDRTHRIGQKNVVQVIKVICENSIEQKVIELQRIKKEVADRIIADDDSNFSKLDISDIKYLLY